MSTSTKSTQPTTDNAIATVGEDSPPPPPPSAASSRPARAASSDEGGAGGEDGDGGGVDGRGGGDGVGDGGDGGKGGEQPSGVRSVHAFGHEATSKAMRGGVSTGGKPVKHGEPLQSAHAQPLST